MKYVQPYDQPSTPTAPYVDLNAAQGIDGSIIPAAFPNSVQNEILNVIIGAGLTPSATALNQLYLAILALIPPPIGGPSDASLVHWGIDSSTSANSVVLNPTPTVTSVAPGFSINFVPANSSTGPTTATINLISGSATFPVLRNDLTALIPSADVVAGRRMTIIFDGVQFFVGFPAPYVMRLESLSSSGLWVPDKRARSALVIATGGGGGGGAATYGLPGAGTGQGGGGGGTDINVVPLLGVTGVPYAVGVGGAPGIGNGNDGLSGGATSFGIYANALGGQGGYGDLASNTIGLPGVGQIGILRLAGCMGLGAGVGIEANNGGFGGASFWGGGGNGGTAGHGTIGPTDAGPGSNGGGGGAGQEGSPTGQGGRGGNGVLFILTT